MRDILLTLRKVGRRRGFDIALCTAVLCASPALSEISISGRVKLPSGQAATGVQLRLHSLPSTYDRLARELGVGEDKALRRVSTDRTGRFSMASIEPGGYLLRLAAPGFLPLILNLRPLHDSVRLSDIRLTEAVRMQLRVRDAQGVAVPGARVRWTATLAAGPGTPASGRFQPWRWMADSLWLNTDLRGGVVGRRAADGFVRMHVLADGYEVLISATKELPQVSMVAREDLYEVVVLIRSVDAVPLAGVIAADASGFARGMSNERGQWRTRVVAGDEITFYGPAGRFGAWTAEAPSEIEGATQAVVTLTRPPDLYGTVYSTWDEPIVGAWVNLLARDGRRVISEELAQTDLKGQYRIPLYPAQSYHLLARARGYLPANSTLLAMTFNIAEDRDFFLVEQASAEGVVADGEGNLVADVEVAFVPRARGPFSGSHRTVGVARSSSEGAFQVEGLKPRSTYTIRVSAEDYAPLEIPFEAPAAGLTDRIDLILDRGRSLRGRVVSRDGDPVGGALVELSFGKAVSPLAWSPEATVESDEDGDFRASRLQEGVYELLIGAPGFAVARRTGVKVGPGETELEDIVLEPSVALVGRVVDRRERPLAGVAVRVSRRWGDVRSAWGTRGSSSIRGSGPMVQVESDDAGRFEIADLVAGQPVGLVLRREGYAVIHAPQIVVPSDDSLIFEMLRVGSMSGVVFDEEGEPAAAAVLLSRGQQTRQTRTSDNGEFLVENLAPGTYHLEAHQREAQRKSPTEAVTIAEGQAVEDLEIVLSEAGERRRESGVVRGRIVDSQGRGIIAMVHASEAGKGPRGPGSASDSSGQFVLSRVSVGLTDLSARREGGVWQVVDTLEVVVGDNEVDLRLEGSTIHGQVVDEEGNGVDYARILMGGQDATRSSSDGRFEIVDVEAGSHSLRATHDRLVSAESTEVEVAFGEEVAVEIQMMPGGVIQGRVLGVEAESLLSVSVEALGPDRRERLALDSEGRFRVEGVAPGTWTLHGRWTSRGREVRQTIEIGSAPGEVEQDLDFSQEGWAVRGRIVLDGQPLLGVRLTLASSEEGEVQRRATSDWRGWFLFDGLPAGMYRLLAPGPRGDDSPLWTEIVEVDGDRDLGDLIVD